METRFLEVFARVVERGSFASAAKDLGLDPSAVSRAIANLEQELGVRLMHRTTRSLSLTEEGSAVHARVLPILEALDEAIQGVQVAAGRPSGTLKITSSVAFGERCLVPLMKGFQQAFPALRVELLLSDETLDLVANGIDLAIRLGDRVSGNVVAAKWTATRYRVCASPAYLQAATAIREPDALSVHACLVYALADFQTSWTFRAMDGKQIKVPIHSGMVISNALALRRACVEGLGVALLADWLVEEDITAGRLLDLFPNHDATATSFETAVWFVYPSRAFLPNKVRATIDYFRQVFPAP